MVTQRPDGEKELGQQGFRKILIQQAIKTNSKDKVKENDLNPKKQIYQKIKQTFPKNKMKNLKMKKTQKG